MDRSFLSQPEVIAASRKFVCIRLLSYENKNEAAYLKAICPTRSGELENTVVCMLSPDAKKMLSYAARGTEMLFGNAANMASSMNTISAKIESNPVTLDLPEVANVRLGLDVAASDKQPLVVAYGQSAENLKALRESLCKLAWSEGFIGRFTYAAALDSKDLSAVPGSKPGVLIVQPDRFGQKGSILARAESPVDIESALKKGLAAHQKIEDSFGQHVRDGHRQGIFWDTLLPVTDPQEAQARQRGKQMRKNP